MTRWLDPGTFQDGLDQVLPNGNLTFPAHSPDRGTQNIRAWMQRIWLHGFISGRHDLAEQVAEAGLRRFGEGGASVAEHEALLSDLDRLTSQDSTLERSLRYDASNLEAPETSVDGRHD